MTVAGEPIINNNLEDSQEKPNRGVHRRQWLSHRSGC
jgi:hypothetical protein